MLNVSCDDVIIDTTIAELIKEITDSDDFMSSLAVEQGTSLVYICIVYLLVCSIIVQIEITAVASILLAVFDSLNN